MRIPFPWSSLLQRAQNTLAWIVLPNLQSTPSVLSRLHWLPVAARIKYKLELNHCQLHNTPAVVASFTPAVSTKVGLFRQVARTCWRYTFNIIRVLQTCLQWLCNICLEQLAVMPLSIRSFRSFNQFKPHLKTHTCVHLGLRILSKEVHLLADYSHINAHMYARNRLGAKAVFSSSWLFQSCEISIVIVIVILYTTVSPSRMLSSVHKTFETELIW